jgi:AcrR family transcriptional regulator
MARPVNTKKRVELLSKLVAHVGMNGLYGQSITTIGTAVDTSPRMLIHYFGSIAKLRLEVMKAVSERFREMLRELPSAVTESPTRYVLTIANQLASPEYRRVMSAFFELYGISVNDPEGHADFASRSVESYLIEFRKVTAGWGVPEASRDKVVTLMLGLGRGLSADMVATGDIQRVVDTANWFAEILEREVCRERANASDY